MLRAMYTTTLNTTPITPLLTKSTKITEMSSGINQKSDKAFELIEKSDLTKSIESEAKHCSTDKVWSSLLCALGLSLAIGKKIQSLYPDYGHNKYI